MKQITLHIPDNLWQRLYPVVYGISEIESREQRILSEVGVVLSFEELTEFAILYILDHYTTYSDNIQ